MEQQSLVFLPAASIRLLYEEWIGWIGLDGQDWMDIMGWKLEIYMYRNQKKSFVKIRAPFATLFSHAKNLGGPLG